MDERTQKATDNTRVVSNPVTPLVFPGLFVLTWDSLTSFNLVPCYYLEPLA